MLDDLAVRDAEHVEPRRGVRLAVLVLAVAHEGQGDEVALGDDRDQPRMWSGTGDRLELQRLKYAFTPASPVSAFGLCW